MKTFWLVIGAILLPLIQVGIINRVGPWHPDLTLLLLTIGIVSFPRRELFLVAGMLALMADLLSQLSFGVVSVSLLTAALLLRLTNETFFAQRSWPSILVVALLLPIIFHLLVYIFNELYVYAALDSVPLGSLRSRILNLTVPVTIINGLVIFLTLLVRPYLLIPR